MHQGSMVVLCAFCLSLAVSAKSSTLQGVITGYDGDVVPEAPVQLTNEDTGNYWRTYSSGDGTYSFDGIPRGAYTLAVNVPCCSLDSFNEKGIPVDSDVSEFNPVLAIGNGLGTLGDDFSRLLTILRERQGELPDLPVPTLDGKPDLSGFWLMIPDPFPDTPDPKPWSAELAAERRASGFEGSPGISCLPQRPTGPIGWTRFVQAPDRLIMLMEATPGWRQIFLDGRTIEEDPNPTWLGHSVGHWEGKTLVIESTGYNDRGWNFGFPISEKLKVTEYYERTDYGHMTYRAVFDDPEVFETPWTQRLTLELAPKEELLETVCENNRW